jgi:hypothetical protein
MGLAAACRSGERIEAGAHCPQQGDVCPHRLGSHQRTDRSLGRHQQSPDLAARCAAGAAPGREVFAVVPHEVVARRPDPRLRHADRLVGVQPLLMAMNAYGRTGREVLERRACDVSNSATRTDEMDDRPVTAVDAVMAVVASTTDVDVVPTRHAWSCRPSSSPLRLRIVVRTPERRPAEWPRRAPGFVPPPLSGEPRLASWQTNRVCGLPTAATHHPRQTNPGPTLTEPSLVVLNQMRFAYPGNDVPALDGISLELGRGTLTAVTGPVGSGKSALARVVAGLYEIESSLATIKVLAIVTGHVLGAIAAHDRAIRLLPPWQQATGQLPLLAVMVLYTFTGLYLLFGI